MPTFLNCGCRVGDYQDEIMEFCREHDPHHPAPSAPPAAVPPLSSEDIHDWAEQQRIGRDISDEIQRERHR
jgi:hypothetical protein